MLVVVRLRRGITVVWRALPVDQGSSTLTRPMGMRRGVEAFAVDGASQVVEGAAGGADKVGEDVLEKGLDPAFDFGLNLVEHIIAVALEGEVALLLLALAAYFVEGSLDTVQSVSVELSCFGIDRRRS
jgi:hypothetical protein